MDEVQNKRLELEEAKLKFEQERHRDNHALELRRLAMAEKAQEAQLLQNELLFRFMREMMDGTKGMIPNSS